MAVIQETLVLQDRFTPVFNNYIALMTQADSITRQSASVTGNAAQSANVLAGAYRTTAAAAQTATAKERLASVQSNVNAAVLQAQTDELRNYIITQQQSVQETENEALAYRASAEALSRVTDQQMRGASAYQSRTSKIRAQTAAQRQANQQLNTSETAQKRLNAETNKGTKATEALSGAVRRLTSAFREKTVQIRANISAQRQAEQAAVAGGIAQKRINSEMNKGVVAAGSLAGSLSRLAGAYLSIQGIKAVMNVSDSLSQTGARLDMVNEKFNTTLDLQNMIRQSAERSRGSYQDTADMVAKLGILASEAFKGPEEIVAFAEQLNKQMTLSGTSAMGAQAAMLQLTQAMSSGALRGEELNSILEQTPLIAQSIAKYMGVTTGEMRELASDGMVTAEVVKNAMFAAAEETNRKFAQMPYTWSQVFTQFKNIVLQTFEPILQLVGKAAGWTAENIEIVIPIFYGAAAAAAAFTIATKLSQIEVAKLSATLLSSPIGWIALLIGIVVVALYKWVQAIGGVKVAWLSLKNIVLTGVETMHIGIDSFAYGAMNSFDKLKVGALQSVEKMINGAINGINKLREISNSVLGTSFGMINHVSMGAEAAVKSAAAAKERESKLSHLKANILEKQITREVEIRQAKAKAATDATSPNNPALDYTNYADLDIKKDTDSIKKDTGSIKKAVNMAEEDIKSLVDVATRKYINKINLTSQTPIITINGANTGNTAEDRKAMADTLRDIILEQAAASSARSTAMVM